MSLPHLPNLTQIIEVVVIFIAAGSFVISYNNLHQSAIEMGIPYPMNYIFPLTIDAFLIICTLYVLYAGQRCKPAWEGWIFLILYTAASIAFNIHMAPDDNWSKAGFAMCPVGLCIALHFLMRILEIEMGGCPVPVAPPEKEESAIAEPPIIVEEEIQNCVEVTEKQLDDMNELCKIQSADLIEQNLTANQMKVLEVYTADKDISKAEACRRTGLSYKTVSGHYNTLKELGMIKDAI